MKFVAHNVAETGHTIKFVEQTNAEDRFAAQNVSKRRHLIKFVVHIFAEGRNTIKVAPHNLAESTVEPLLRIGVCSSNSLATR